MGTELQTGTQSPIAELMRLTTPLVSSALVGEVWNPEWGRRVFDREQIDVKPLIVAHDNALRPVVRDWLADRLRLLWKSSTPSSGLDATAWLHETARLLGDIPQDILAVAIDDAVRKSERGFMPSVGEIRAFAEPQLKRRKLHCWRLKQIAALEPEPPLPQNERCTPAQAAEIRKAAGIRYDDDGREKSADWIPVEQRTNPTRADYIVWGVDPADIPASVTQTEDAHESEQSA